MTDHVQNRDYMLAALNEELLGPAPAGPEIDCSKPLAFSDKSAAYGPLRQAGSGEEILIRDSPTRRYGIGVLYPQEGQNDAEVLEEVTTGSLDEAPDAPISEGARKELSDIQARLDGPGGADPGEDGSILSGVAGFRPSSMAVSLLTRLGDDDRLLLRASGGTYRSITVTVEGKEREWWLRVPFALSSEVSAKQINAAPGRKITCTPASSLESVGPELRFELFPRPRANGENLLTVCLVNRSSNSKRADASCLFQAGFEVSVESSSAEDGILPYPTPPISHLDLEEQGLELLYRDRRTFAVGHGCAADWDAVEADVCRVVRGVALPYCETPSMTPDALDSAGARIEVPMLSLASTGTLGLRSLDRVASAYREWLALRWKQLESLEPQFQAAARHQLQACDRCASRIEDGIRFLGEDPRALRAFQLMNEAVLYQQLNSGREPRTILGGPPGPRRFSATFSPPNLTDDRASKPTWRAFQIAFLLMSLRSVAQGDNDDRETVELIWFPTGGGKTEAYLGLAAFAAFYRRLTRPSDDGVQILMRYTLRLLTAQQFQRAARLICAMEVLRRREPAALGTTCFSIGIWLGGDTTPNKRADAVAMLRKLGSGDRYADNGFLLDRCPWCRAQIGVLKGTSGRFRVIGYEQRGATVAFCCSDNSCEFTRSLPVYVIDEDIYDERPTLVIGTVDKFAALSWKSDARAIFGLGPDGGRLASPPNLIIQDELHLISGPLGSVVGLYEVLIEELCTDRRTPSPTKPKIVCSTATIRRYEDQVRALYGRQRVELFPPPAIDAADSFFARYARRADGRFERGRIYAGIYAPGLGSLQTAQVRSFSAILDGANRFDADGRDPWWTLVLFFNSLRELGGTVSLLQSDIPDYLRTIRNRTGNPDLRYLNQVLELTSRLTREEVPKALSSLEVTTTIQGGYPIDVCLASSIIEVGIDIDRLSIMAIVGQPKTTAQYIQVSGRIGRQWQERPGLVVTIYGAAKARDRSHYERFRTYHERLYAHVEPTSVTPFSKPVVERALHAVMAAFVRQTGTRRQAETPEPCPTWMLDELLSIIESRVKIVDGDEQNDVRRSFERRIREWKRWQSRFWDASPDAGEIPLLRRAGSYAPVDWFDRSWSTPQSMRNVDAECQADITDLYS